jgi:hypothetical protein
MVCLVDYLVNYFVELYKMALGACQFHMQPQIIDLEWLIYYSGGQCYKTFYGCKLLKFLIR